MAGSLAIERAERVESTLVDATDPDIMAMLHPEVLLGAYADGIFPMVQDGELMGKRGSGTVSPKEEEI